MDSKIKKPQPHLQRPAVAGSCSTILDSTAAQLTFQFSSDGLICITRARQQQLSVRFPPSIQPISDEILQILQVFQIPKGEGGLLNWWDQDRVWRNMRVTQGRDPHQTVAEGTFASKYWSRPFQSLDVFLIWLIHIGTLGVKEAHTFPKLVVLWSKYRSKSKPCKQTCRFWLRPVLMAEDLVSSLWIQLTAVSSAPVRRGSIALVQLFLVFQTLLQPLLIFRRHHMMRLFYAPPLTHLWNRGHYLLYCTLSGLRLELKLVFHHHLLSFNPFYAVRCLLLD